VHQEVLAHLNGDSKARMRTIDGLPTPELITAAHYYIHLLGMRKHLWDIARQKLERDAGHAVNEQEVSNDLQQRGSPRAQLLARQGKEPKVPEHICNDERLVVIALMLAVITGQEATVISSDEAVLDQFYKLTALLSWHYLAMSIADRYAGDPLSFATELVENPDRTVLAGAKVTLLRKSTPVPLDLLPLDPQYVMAHCILLQDEVTRVTFNEERGMRRLFEVKARSGGKNTDLLGDRNCHLFLNAESRAKVGDRAAIDNDITAPIDGLGISLAGVDLGLCLHSDEQHAIVRGIDQRTLWLPRQYCQKLRETGRTLSALGGP
jgi:hypothetical protein